MDYQDINVVKKLAKKMAYTKHWRKGQCFFNALYTEYPEEANKIRGTGYDPFYSDDRIDKCIEYLLNEAPI